MSKTLWYLVAYATIRLWRDPLWNLAEWLYRQHRYQAREAAYRLSTAPACWLILNVKSGAYGHALRELLGDGVS